MNWVYADVSYRHHHHRLLASQTSGKTARGGKHAPLPIALGICVEYAEKIVFSRD
jgi:hypothetical protein